MSLWLTNTNNSFDELCLQNCFYTDNLAKFIPLFRKIYQGAPNTLYNYYQCKDISSLRISLITTQFNRTLEKPYNILAYLLSLPDADAAHCGASLHVQHEYRFIFGQVSQLCFLAYFGMESLTELYYLEDITVSNQDETIDVDLYIHDRYRQGDKSVVRKPFYIQQDENKTKQYDEIFQFYKRQCIDPIKHNEYLLNDLAIEPEKAIQCHLKIIDSFHQLAKMEMIDCKGYQWFLQQALEHAIAASLLMHRVETKDGTEELESEISVATVIGTLWQGWFSSNTPLYSVEEANQLVRFQKQVHAIRQVANALTTALLNYKKGFEAMCEEPWYSDDIGNGDYRCVATHQARLGHVRQHGNIIDLSELFTFTENILDESDHTTDEPRSSSDEDIHDIDTLTIPAKHSIFECPPESTDLGLRQRIVTLKTT